MRLPGAEIELSLKEYAKAVCGLLDIPVHNSVIEPLHLLFTLFSDFKVGPAQHAERRARARGCAACRPPLRCAARAPVRPIPPPLPLQANVHFQQQFTAGPPPGPALGAGLGGANQPTSVTGQGESLSFD